MDTPSYPRLLPVGDAALSVEFGAEYAEAAAARALHLGARLAALAVPGLMETVPTLRALLIHYDPAVLSARRLRAVLHGLPEATEAGLAQGAAWCLPACYAAEFAPDLDALSERLGLDAAAVVALHAGGRYRAAMVGGYPGYPYLAGLDPRLAVPRRTTPRLAVPAGSVAVANGFTAVYPDEVPGGWHLLGRTPVPLFDPARPRPALIAPGDAVTFRAVDAAEYAALHAAFRDGRADPVTACRA